MCFVRIHHFVNISNNAAREKGVKKKFGWGFVWTAQGSFFLDFIKPKINPFYRYHMFYISDTRFTHPATVIVIGISLYETYKHAKQNLKVFFPTSTVKVTKNSPLLNCTIWMSSSTTRSTVSMSRDLKIYFCAFMQVLSCSVALPFCRKNMQILPQRKSTLTLHTSICMIWNLQWFHCTCLWSYSCKWRHINYQ